MRTQTQLNKITSEVSLRVRRVLNDHLHSIILYGSYARGDYSDHSDVDIMVLADVSDNERPTFQKSIDKISSAISLENDIVVSISFKNKKFFDTHTSVLPFYRNIVKEGVEVYAAK